MENKKGSLPTVFLVIAIILIGVMGVFMYMQKTEAARQIAELENNERELQETIDDLKGGIDSISDTINDKNSINLNENNLIQFNTEFYELNDVAKEYREYKNIKNYKDFNHDLDGDGITDKIRISHKTKTDYRIGERDYYEITLNGETFSEGSEMDSIYIVDLNENDKNIEVVIFGEGPSDDPHYTIYSKKGNKMVEIDGIGGYPLKTDKKGTVVIKDNCNGVTVPEIYFGYEIIQNGNVDIKTVDLETIRDIELKTSHFYFSRDYKDVLEIHDELGKNNQNIEKTLKNLDIEKLNEDITFKVKEIYIQDEYSYDYKIFVELSDGREGYIFHIQWAG